MEELVSPGMPKNYEEWANEVVKVAQESNIQDDNNQKVTKKVI